MASSAILSTESGKTSWRSSVQTSVAIHLAIATVFTILAWPRKKSETLDFEVYEQPKVATALPVRLSKPIEEKKPEKRAVFGVSRKALTDSTDGTAPDLKKGNTVAKNPDQEKLRESDEDSLPIPTEEYLVTAMPTLDQEYRIPYPPQAKKAGIQGRVIMDLLIDNEGKVRKADLVDGPGSGLNEAALEAVKSFRFKPARIQDRPVAVRIRYSYHFILER